MSVNFTQGKSNLLKAVEHKKNILQDQLTKDHVGTSPHELSRVQQHLALHSENLRFSLGPYYEAT